MAIRTRAQDDYDRSSTRYQGELASGALARPWGQADVFTGNVTPIKAADAQLLHDNLLHNGFVSLADITDADDIRAIREEVLDLLANLKAERHKFNDLGDADPAGGAPSILEVHSPSALRPRLLNSRFMKRAVEVSRAILGASARFQFDHCISKPPLNATETAWHQDYAYQRIKRATHRLHWWLPLQDVNEDNGCMKFIPGSHLGPLVPHAPRSAGAYALQAKLPEDALPVTCPLSVGGATIHLPKTLHCTGPNNTNAARHAWIMQIGFKGWLPWDRPLK
jgi:ectoine hydroxylase-related dioxygenase (phytanoyl-CoA dioxygenase family)